MEEILSIALFFALGLIGLIVGSLLEKRHYRSIRMREEKYRHILVFSEKSPPGAVAGQSFYLVQGSVVISGDYFKQIVASLKNILGGRLTTYESLLDRGRREAILRMKEEADKRGARAIFNVKLETCMLNQKQTGRQGLVCAEMLAYGTAWKIAPPAKQTA